MRCESVELKLRLPFRESFSIIDMKMWIINLVRASIFQYNREANWGL